MWTGHVIGVNFAAAMITGQEEARAAGKTTRRIWINHTLTLGAEAGAAAAALTAADGQARRALRTGKSRHGCSRQPTARADAVFRRQDKGASCADAMPAGAAGALCQRKLAPASRTTHHDQHPADAEHFAAGTPGQIERLTAGVACGSRAKHTAAAARAHAHKGAAAVWAFACLREQGKGANRTAKFQSQAARMAPHVIFLDTGAAARAKRPAAHEAAALFQEDLGAA